MNYKDFLKEYLLASGKISLEYFGKIKSITQKEDPNQVVTVADLEIEKMIIAAIEEKYPDHSIIAEESGYKDKNSEYTWIIDPLDGTSNYAAGIPWFGNMIALLKNWKPIVSGIYLPVTDEMYLSERGKGMEKNGEQITITHKGLREGLISFCADTVTDDVHRQRIARIYESIFSKARNIRATNSAPDYVYAAEGKLGGAVNLNNKIWDVAPIILLVEEAGGIITDSIGKEIDLRVTRETYTRSYEIVIGNKITHPQLLKAVQ